MKIIILFQVLTLIAGGLIALYFRSQNEALSFVYGALLILGNFIFMGTTWGQIFKKKYIALSVLGIVSKYAILAAILIYLVRVVEVDLLWFSLGVGSFVVSSVLYAVKESSNNEVDKDGI